MRLLLLALALLTVLPVKRDPTKVRAEGAEERVAEVYAAIDAATEDPDLRQEMRNVCARESWCNAFSPPSIHELESRPAWVRKTGEKWWRGAVRKGHVVPDACPEHELGDPARWYNRGVFALVPGGALRYFEECLPPEAIDDPRVSAIAYVANAERLCEEQRRCTCEQRAPVFFGVGLWKRRRPWRRVVTMARQCGPRPWHEKLNAIALEFAFAMPRAATWLLTRAHFVGTLGE